MNPHLSPPSSPTSDSDGFNTDSARLHFGPFRTPEAKFIQARDRLTLNVAISATRMLRRSPRLSSPRPTPVTLEKVELNGVEEALIVAADDSSSLSSCSGTPVKFQLSPDEPSSSLADRVLRAHDNPSPPPSPSCVTIDELPNCSLDTLGFLPALPTTDVSNNNADEDLRRTSSIPLDCLTNEYGDSVPSPPPNPGITKAPVSPNLISFESDMFTPTSHSNVALGSGIPSDFTPDKPTIDQLLSYSPSPLTEISSTDSPKSIESANEPPGQKTHSSPIGSNYSELNAMTTPQLRSTDFEKPDASELSILPISQALPIPQVLVTPMRRSPRSPLGMTPMPSCGSGERKSKRKDNSTTTPLAINKSILKDASLFEASNENEDRIPPEAFQRELGSLSPTSNGLLEQLIPSVPIPVVKSRRESPEFIGPQNQKPGQAFHSSFSTGPLPAFPMTPDRTVTSVRLQSPYKPRLMAPASSSTPARRIPIEQAFAQGQNSPQKGYKNMHLAVPAFGGTNTVAFNIPRVDSPARRVLVSPALAPSSGRKTLRFGSPTRSPSKEPQTMFPDEPNLSHKLDYKGKGRADNQDRLVMDAHAMKSSTAEPIKPAKLPFPIVATTTIGQVDGRETKRDTYMSSPAKSTLRQQPKSKIPRREVKPYVRPVLSKSEDTAMQRITVKPIAKRPKVEDKSGRQETTAAECNVVIKPENPLRPLLTISDKAKGDVMTLKRKREAETKSSPASAKHRPMIFLRQVPPLPSSQTPASTTAPISSIAPLNSTTVKTTITRRNPPSTITQTQKPTQSQGVYKIRRVITPEPIVHSSPQETPNIDTFDVQPMSLDVFSIPIPQIVTIPEQFREHLAEPSSSPRIPSSEPLLPSSPSPPDIPQGKGVRRTTRSRKLHIPTITNNALGANVRSIQSRRKANTQPSQSNDAFAGMSATALKALTNSNTVRNQQYVAAKLEMEVIRKEGMRPESPTMKVQSILHRQQEERGKQRKERADRRARRNGFDESAFEEEGGYREGEGASENEYSNVTEAEREESLYRDDSPVPRKHRRGAGDDEDYETPVRNAKKSKPDNELDGDEKRVKWDKGLYTTVYLDDVKLGCRVPTKDLSDMRGCLTPKAKAARLDALGNLPEAGLPLPELVEESIIVKKFVFDDDVEAVQKVVVTRSKTKKSKS